MAANKETFFNVTFRNVYDLNTVNDYNWKSRHVITYEPIK